MLTLEQIKDYLRIDGHDDDALLIMLDKAADASMAGAIDDYHAKYEKSAQTDSPDFVKMSDMIKCAIIAELYERRVNDNGGAANFTFPIRCMLTQLQFYTGDDIKAVEDGGNV